MQRRASNSGVVVVVGQNVALGRVHADKTVTIHITDTELAIACDDGTRIVRGNTDPRVRKLEASRPRSRPDVAAMMEALPGPVVGVRVG
ncbi:hypothetical protein [Micromonospora sp. NPDC005305]|uniref:hypothetical protein n=1 Tax=Micromonospora sp. NPDC005305 TaxID=3156875 RepID=UPI0033AFAA44